MIFQLTVFSSHFNIQTNWWAQSWYLPSPGRMSLGNIKLYWFIKEPYKFANSCNCVYHSFLYAGLEPTPGSIWSHDTKFHVPIFSFCARYRAYVHTSQQYRTDGMSKIFFLFPENKKWRSKFYAITKLAQSSEKTFLPVQLYTTFG